MNDLRDKALALAAPNRPEMELISIVDDDESVRESLPDLLRVFGLTAKAFVSAGDFLGSGSMHDTKCLILDIAMPGMSGLELWQTLKSRGYSIPVIFITADDDRDLRRRLMHQGAIDCLSKPFSDTDLSDALRRAFRIGDRPVTTVDIG